MSDIYVVVDWDREEIVDNKATNRMQAAVLRKAEYCDRIGIAQDTAHEEPRFRVTIENIELSDDDDD